MVIKTKNLVKRYGDLIALDHLNLEINEGEIFGLLGPNGSGKSTAIHCMLSLLKYDKGSVELFGRNMTPADYDIKRDIGVVMQEVAVFNELTVLENIDYFCGLYIPDEGRRNRLVREAVDFCNLAEFTRYYPKKLSGGLLARLNIACGIAHKPKLIIMDEPTVSVDPQTRNSILEGVMKLNKEGATVLYTSHYMEEVEQICTRLAILDRGKIVASGTSEELKELIGVGEKIQIEVFNMDSRVIEILKENVNISYVNYTGKSLVIKSNKGKHNLAYAIEILEEYKVPFGNIASTQPTLNDVFLEITGKGLRDDV